MKIGIEMIAFTKVLAHEDGSSEGEFAYKFRKRAFKDLIQRKTKKGKFWLSGTLHEAISLLKKKARTDISGRVNRSEEKLSATTLTNGKLKAQEASHIQRRYINLTQIMYE